MNRSVFLGGLLLLNVGALVMAEGGDHPDFEKHKAEILAKIEEHKSCVSAATDGAGLRKCHEAMREHRMEHMQQRKDRLEKRMDRMKEKTGK